jgi:predicted protein tyrosine phosphatase
MLRVLFVCSQNRLRSPTAEQVFSHYPGIQVESAGVDPSARNPLTPELLEWAELIFVMEQSHRRRLRRRFGKHLKSQFKVCLGIADIYRFMEPALIAVLRQRVPKHLPGR